MKQRRSSPSSRRGYGDDVTTVKKLAGKGGEGLQGSGERETRRGGVGGKSGARRQAGESA